ncbi:replication protein P [Aliidiomarina maris]|nr:replication protein P [Aliidiomarina maris]RUO28449.1 hypothetical protein CWE07_01180 [Aliidiomarina maris]
MTTLMTELAPAMTIYCPDFSKRFGDKHVENVMREYAYQLFQNNISLADFRRGIERMKQRTTTKWTPTPIEFLELCKLQASDFGFPTKDEVYREVEGYSRHKAKGSSKPYEFSGRFAELICQDIMYAFRLSTEDKRQTLLDASYTKWVDYQRRHGFLPKQATQLEAPAPRHSSADYQRMHPFAERIERIKQARRQRPQRRRGAA